MVMRQRLIALATLGGWLFFQLPTARAQRPSSARVQQMLQSSPELAAKLRNRLASSGLTNDQIRARLRAAGYPDSLLDAYMPGGDSTKVGSVDDIARAMRAVEVADSVAQASSQPRPTILTDTAPRSTIYGLDVFRRPTTQFDATTAGPVDAGYRVGPHDVLALILTGGVEAAYTLEISPEGFVVIPQVGQVFVSNLTLDQITNVFYAKLGAVYSGVRRGAGAATRFSLTVARVRTNQIFVIGNVVAPGSYQVSSAGTILTALYAAGGPAETGSLRDVQLRRGGRTITTLDLYDYLINGDASHDTRLESGDVVFVPFHGRFVDVAGEVGRPMTYELRQHETLAELVRFAGGFKPTAATQRIQIRRVLDPAMRDSPGMDRVVIDVPGVGAEGVPTFALQGGDKVLVFPVTDVERNRITVAGNVWAPGELGYRAGMRVSDALRSAGGVKPDTYLDQVLIGRHLADGSSLQLRTRLADTTGRAIGDVVLLENDTITVFSRNDFRPGQYITVSGAVRNGGQIAYREGMTLRDAVLMSGGLEESAYLPSAEVARMSADRSHGRLADTIHVVLDSSFLFERGARKNASSLDGGVAQAGAPMTELPLRPYDQVLILRQPDWHLEQFVTIAGEVRFPGTYALTRRDEKLTDLIARAGGLTERANADGLRFFRRADSLGRIDVDYEEASRHPKSRNNFILVAGDSIDVPTFMPVVKVSGAVSTPSTVAYAPGKDANYYIEQAGGLALEGDRGRLVVTQPSGARELYRKHAFIIPDHVPVPLAGGEVFVPRKAESKSDAAAVWGAIAQVTAGLVTVLVVALKR